MPPSSAAVNTSKRKFYKLLDNISTSKQNLHEKNASSTTLATDPPNKRFRPLKDLRTDRPLTAPSTATRSVSVAGERPTSSVRAVGGVTSSFKTRPKSYAPTRTAGEDAADRVTPNYAPWDHEQFLARLKTFADVRTWTPKASAIGEVEWAKRGWVVVAKDTVGCKGGCENRLVVKLTKDSDGVENSHDTPDDEEDGSWWRGDVERELIERYKDLIVEGHEEECLWRGAGCKDDIYRIKMADPTVWQQQLKERYSSLLTVESALPNHFRIAQDDASDTRIQLDVVQITKRLPPELLAQPRKDKENTTPAKNSHSVETPTKSAEPTEDGEKDFQVPDKLKSVALALAMCGWTGQDVSGVQLAYCPKCFQRAGLWLYKSLDRSKTIADTSVLDNESMVFDPVDLHREHCPWKNPASQCAIGSLKGLAGWQVLVSLVQGYRRRDGGGYEDSLRTTENVSSNRKSIDDDDSPRKTRTEIEAEDKARKSKLQKLKRAFTVKKKPKV